MLLIIFVSLFFSQIECNSSNVNAEISTMTETYQIVSCKPGYALLSCGIDDIGYYDGYSSTGNNIHPSMTDIIIKESQGPGSPKYAHPINETSCACADLSVNNWLKKKLSESSDLVGKYQPSNCVAWCHKTENLTQHSSVASSAKLLTAMHSQCSEGSKAIGCHMQFGIDRKDSILIDIGRFYYPTFDGKSCYCHDTRASKCISSCISDDSIEGYEIVIVKGLDEVVVAKCPSESVVLGCGTKPEFISDDGKYERYPVAFVSGFDSCVCRSRHNGAACYAVCAKSLE